MERKKIFVSAYACEPGKGSEIGVGWHWILEMSNQYELWVLTRKSNKLNIEEWIKKHPDYNDIKFVYYDLPKWMRWWKKGLRGVRTYYCLWQRCSNKLVKKVMKNKDIKTYHLLTYGNALWPASRYGMKQQFVWGPIGGTDTVPTEFISHYDVKSKLIEWTRHILVKLLPVNIGYRNRCKNADIILCKTEYMKENIPLRYRDKAVVFTDVAVDENIISDNEVIIDKDKEKYINNSNVVKYLAVGRLDAWRGFDLLIEAFYKAREQKDNIQLEILGEGRYKQSLQKIIAKYELEDRITLAGHLSEREYRDRLEMADVIINPALKEGNVTASFDAMGNAKPLICVDTKGYSNVMGSNAIVIQRGTRQQTINDLANAIIKIEEYSVRKCMSKNSERLAKINTWKEKGKTINALLNRVVK